MIHNHSVELLSAKLTFLSLQVKDIVKVIDGPHSGRQGEIKHVFRNFAFLHSRMMMDNGGIFVCKCRHLVLAGAGKAGGKGAGAGGEAASHWSLQTSSSSLIGHYTPHTHL